MAKVDSSYIERVVRLVLMRGIRPAVYLPVTAIRYLPGHPAHGWKRLVIRGCCAVDAPLLRLNSWMYEREVLAERVGSI